jgi:hypothetical protein
MTTAGHSPAAAVKDRFGDKEKLAAAIQSLATKDLWLDRVSEDKGLERVSNAKLLRLHTALSTAKERFGSRAKLVDAILQLENRSKDSGFKARLEEYPLPRLLDTHKSAERRAKVRKAAPVKAPVAKKKLARSRKAQAKVAK